MLKMESSDQSPLQRSLSLDQSLLQRPPSIHSIRAYKRQATYSGSTVGDIVEESETNQSEVTVTLNSPLLENESLLKHVSSSPNKKQSALDELSIRSVSMLQVNQRDNAIPGTNIVSDTNDLINCDVRKPLVGYDECIECVKAIPVISEDEIEEGDHIVFAGAVYDHHGIVVSKDGKKFRIIEATNTISGAVLGFSKFFGGKARIADSQKEFNFATDNIRVVEYQNRIHSKKMTAEIAENILAEERNKSEKKKQKFSYDLFDNNCEHFATFCATGKSFSIQVTKFRITAKLFLSSGFIGISDERIRNQKQFENKIICEQCFQRNEKLLCVTIKPITKQENCLGKGDIIRYTYWNLWHEAVVLEVINQTPSYLTCKIAHYAFCGLFKHRTIKVETLKINFDDSCCVLDYKSPEFNVYDSDTVVQRAYAREGEKQFVFFSNDSSHFARWCKLKLGKQ